MSWNIVFNTVMEIKNKYKNKFGKVDYYSDDSKTTLEYWIESIKDEYYINLFKPIQTVQFGNMVLIRYGDYADVFNDNDIVELNDFWEMYNGFYQECRSLVIDIKDDFMVLTPFKKFRNLNEGKENQLDVIVEKIKNAKTFEITNKYDGSMFVARYVEHYGEIVTSTSSSLDVEKSWRLSDARSILMSQPNYVEMLEKNPHLTFIFEYISVKDTHLVRYTKEQQGLYLIGIKNTIENIAFSYAEIAKIANKNNILSVSPLFTTFDKVLEIIKTEPCHKLEGFVLNIDGHLVKVKTDDYVYMHKAISRCISPNYIIRSIADNKFDDFCSKIPESYKDLVNETARTVYEYINKMSKLVNKYFELSPKGNQKDFANWVKLVVPKQLEHYMYLKYQNKNINYLKSGSSKSPKYIKLGDIKGCKL